MQDARLQIERFWVPGMGELFGRFMQRFLEKAAYAVKMPHGDPLTQTDLPGSLAETFRCDPIDASYAPPFRQRAVQPEKIGQIDGLSQFGRAFSVFQIGNKADAESAEFRQECLCIAQLFSSKAKSLSE